MLRSTLAFIFLLLPAIAQADLISAHRAFESGNYKSAFTQLQPLASDGNVEAQSNLAWLYRNGAGTQRDDGKALYWYLLAAKQGDAYAQYNYAEMCEQGLGIAQSFETAAHWYEKAAMQGQVNAQFSLGEMYLDGAGVEADLVKAYAWIHVVIGSGIEAAEPILEELEFEMSSEQIRDGRELGQEYWNKYSGNSENN